VLENVTGVLNSTVVPLQRTMGDFPLTPMFAKGKCAGSELAVDATGRPFCHYFRHAPKISADG
jgi:hypothetical protein